MYVLSVLSTNLKKTGRVSYRKWLPKMWFSSVDHIRNKSTRNQKVKTFQKPSIDPWTSRVSYRIILLSYRKPLRMIAPIRVFAHFSFWAPPSKSDFRSWWLWFLIRYYTLFPPFSHQKENMYESVIRYDTLLIHKSKTTALSPTITW